MDRFIGTPRKDERMEKLNLKSNMDRFIVEFASQSIEDYLNLKSNMDRFIEPATKDPHEGKTWHEAEYKTEKVWVVDEEACTWQRPIYEEHYASICNTCNEEIIGDEGEHMYEHMQKGENGSYRVEMVTKIVGYETVNEPEQGHYETKTTLVRAEDRKSVGRERVF